MSFIIVRIISFIFMFFCFLRFYTILLRIKDTKTPIYTIAEKYE